MGSQRFGAMGFGQFAATSQFFLFGKKNCTQTGYEKHRKEYEQPAFFDQQDLARGSVFMVTGANSGIGFEIAQNLAMQGGVVYMICRNEERGQAARQKILLQAGVAEDHVVLLLCDCGREAAVRACWQQFCEHSIEARGCVRLDSLVCNAGVLLNDRTLTPDGIETTFATHLLFGTYLLTELALEALQTTQDSRVVVVSSGGMYNCAFPDWEVATSSKGKYDGNLAYAYAKRAQVLLCEHWTRAVPSVKFVSCHPGWTGTAAVDAAYGENKSYLEPLRTPWEGAEAICWLCLAPADGLQSGEFYLDRTTQSKHMAGPFFSEGSFTKNTPEEVSAMVQQLGAWAAGNAPPAVTDEEAISADVGVPLEPSSRPIVLDRFMGRWYVQAGILTSFETDMRNETEDYELKDGKVYVEFNMSNANGKNSQLLQRASVENRPINTRWAISPKAIFYLPLGLPYLILDCGEDYEYAVVGMPDRKYLWIMTRQPQPDAQVLEKCYARAQQCGYDVSKITTVEHDLGAAGEDAGEDGRRSTLAPLRDEGCC